MWVLLKSTCHQKKKSIHVSCETISYSSFGRVDLGLRRDSHKSRLKARAELVDIPAHFMKCLDFFKKKKPDLDKHSSTVN